MNVTKRVAPAEDRATVVPIAKAEPQSRATETRRSDEERPRGAGADRGAGQDADGAAVEEVRAPPSPKNEALLVERPKIMEKNSFVLDLAAPNVVPPPPNVKPWDPRFVSCIVISIRHVRRFVGWTGRNSALVVPIFVDCREHRPRDMPMDEDEAVIALHTMTLVAELHRREGSAETRLLLELITRRQIEANQAASIY